MLREEGLETDSERMEFEQHAQHLLHQLEPIQEEVGDGDGDGLGGSGGVGVTSTTTKIRRPPVPEISRQHPSFLRHKQCMRGVEVP